MNALRTAAPALLAITAGACVRGAALPSVQPDPFDFARMADSIIATPPLDRAHLGILVYDPAAGRTLYAHNAERRFVPASNQKYWVTATALHELGADWRYRTPVLGIGVDATAGTAQALVVVGRGDPSLSSRFHDDDENTPLGMLADSVVAAGIRRIGELIVDASYFDRAIVPGTWTYGNLNGTSAPPTGAFVIDEGIYRIAIAPGRVPGEPALVIPQTPADVEPVVGAVMTLPAGTRGAGTTNRRGPWSDTLYIAGGIAADAEPRTVRVPMTDPVGFAAHAFADALRERGVVIEGGVRIVYDTAGSTAWRADGTDTAGAVPADGSVVEDVREVASWTSPTMAEIVAAILQPSQNWIAEQLVRTLGAERREQGSWRAGTTVQTSFLFDVVGIDSAALRLNDGSGMSHQNLVTPRAVVQLLDHARTAPWADTFRDALARPGRPGTLSNRLRALEGRVEGKTGTLSNVNALSGYVRTRDGRELIFSILGNASGLPSGPVVSAIDALVMALAEGYVPRR